MSGLIVGGFWRFFGGVGVGAWVRGTTDVTYLY